MNRISGKLFISLLPYCITMLISCQGSQIVDVTQGNNLDNVIDSEFKRLQMPGVAYTAIRNDSIVYIGGKGYADRKSKKPFTPQTRMMIASVSKTMAVTSIMQLYEKGMVSLDGDISNYLPFKVRNPDFPDAPITVKMLLTHTSSISDDGCEKSPTSLLLFGYVDYPESMMSFEQNYLTEDGKYYTKTCFSENKPGTQFAYSNVGATLVACLVEHVSGTDYDSYCKEHIFKPLGMTQTTWYFRDTPRDEIATYYTDNNYTDASDQFVTTSVWAECHLITTIEDLSRFLRAYIMGGSFNNFQLLKTGTVDLIMNEYLINSRDEQQGLMFHSTKIGSHSVWGHGGDMYGISTAMYFDKERKAGFIIFNNRTQAQSETLGNALLQYALN